MSFDLLVLCPVACSASQRSGFFEQLASAEELAPFGMSYWAPDELEEHQRLELDGYELFLSLSISLMDLDAVVPGLRHVRAFCLQHGCRLVDPQRDAEEFISLADEAHLFERVS
jgi:hypothetical protein